MQYPRGLAPSLALGAVLLTTLVSTPTDGQAQTSPYDLPIREHVFDNGLRLLVLERP